MERKDRIDLLGGSILVAFSILMGLNQVLVKLVNAGFSPIFQVGLRSACALFPILLYAWLFRKKLSITDGSLVPGVIAGTFFAIEFVLMFTSLEFISVSRASIIFYSMPFWVALVAHFLIPGEQLNVIKVFGLVLSFAGVALVLSDSMSETTDQAWIGDIMCLVGSIFWAGILILVRTTNLSRSSPEMALVYQLSVSAVILLAVAPLFGPLVRELTPTIIGIFSFQVIVVVCIAFIAWFWVASVYPASDMASYGFLAPVFGVFFGWIILGEQITLKFIVALILVCAGIILINRKQVKRSGGAVKV